MDGGKGTGWVASGSPQVAGNKLLKCQAEKSGRSLCENLNWRGTWGGGRRLVGYSLSLFLRLPCTFGRNKPVTHTRPSEK